MSVLFSPSKIGDMEISNRFINAATYDAMATEKGETTDKMIARYGELARGGVGLILSGYMHVSPVGKSMKYQTGIYSDELIPGLQKLADAVHEEGGRIVFQLVHGGRQTSKSLIGQTPMAPSGIHRDMVYMVKPKEMSEDDIAGAIADFGSAARRADEAGADGVQIHAAHGYLINEFLSPFFNQRNDDWGGSDENRFRFLKETTLGARKALPPGKPVLVKLNANDYTPKQGMTPNLAAKYGSWLASLGVDAIEVSAGTACFSVMEIWRGDVPVNDLVNSFPTWQKPFAKIVLKRLQGKFDLEEGYNVEAARTIKPAVGEVPVITVGGFRNLNHMEETLEKGYTDFISMCRPFIREPSLVRKFKEGKSESAKCMSCNGCVAAVVNDRPVQCVHGT